MSNVSGARISTSIQRVLVAVIDRQFKGEVASTMDKLTTRALEAQVEAAVRHNFTFVLGVIQI